MGQLDKGTQELRDRENEYRRQAAELLSKADQLREQGLAMATAANEVHARLTRLPH